MSIEKFTIINSKISGLRDMINNMARPSLTTSMDEYLKESQRIYDDSVKAMNEIMTEHSNIPENIGEGIKECIKQMHLNTNSIQKVYDETMKIFTNFDELDKKYNAMLNGENPIDDNDLDSILVEYTNIMLSIADMGKKLEENQKNHAEQNKHILENMMKIIMESIIPKDNKN